MVIPAYLLPSSAFWIWKWIVFIFFLCLISGGSLAEVFYSLSRVRSKNGQFSSVDKCLAFILVVIVPYVSTKLANLIHRWSEECDDGVYNIDEYTHKRKCIKLYKFFKGVHDCFQVVQYVGYLSNRSKTHAVLNRIVGQHLVYLSTEVNLDWTWSDLFTMNFRNSAVFTGMAFRALELSAFFLQFIQWWQNETNNGSLTKLPNPEAPTFSGKNANAAGRYRNICPVCLQTWKIPTVNRVSGWARDYPKWLEFQLHVQVHAFICSIFSHFTALYSVSNASHTIWMTAARARSQIMRQHLMI